MILEIANKLIDSFFCIMKQLLRNFHKACDKYRLLEDGDHILVALSGGKDSLALVELLGAQQQVFRPRITVTAAHVSVTNTGYQSDIAYLEDFCHQQGIDFHHLTTAYDERDNDRRNKNHCFLCARYRRNALLTFAQQIGCNKIAFGHHRDDILQTFLMNMTLTGKLAPMAPRLPLDKMPLTIIRPLCLIDEKQIAEYAERQGYHRQVKTCPFEHDTARTQARELLAHMEQINPDCRASLWSALEGLL